ncbi:hypothetical protein MN116_000874 [Schistosoma mekongi]|uniref:Phosphatidylinositol glycan, class S n=1 Tax=Schistosoma mekongi TaxID=38744 RepID=A0AAE2D8X4_SCHME|nr:hypothetical protein MN116_000874 [Schistosoma mekongi]
MRQMINSLKSSSEVFYEKYPELRKYQASWEENFKTVIISFIYLFITVFIGIPLWWKSTTPYHAALPYSEIQALSSRKIEIAIPINLVNFHSEIDDKSLNQITEIFTRFNLEQQKLMLKDTSEELFVTYHVDTRQMNQSEIQASYTNSLSNNINEFWLTFEKNLSLLKVLNAKQTLKKYESDDNLIEQKSSSSVYNFILLPIISDLWLDGKNFSNYATTAEPFSVVRNLLNLNVIYVYIPPILLSSKDKTTSELLAFHIKYLIDNTLIQTSHLMKLARKHDDRINLSPGQFNDISKTISEPLTVSDVYDVTVTVLTLDGAASQLAGGESNELSVWTNEMLVNPIPWLKAHVAPAFKHWLPFVQVNFYSQRLYGVGAELLKNCRLAKTGNYTFYSQDDISNLINYLESFLGPPQTVYANNRHTAHSNPGLHLILLLNTHKENSSKVLNCSLPLRFHISSGPFSSVVITDYALVPQWGGLLSVDASDCMTKSGATHIIAQKMIYVIRSILGFPQIKEMHFNQYTDNQAYHLQSSMDFNGITTNWELNSWFLRRTIECLTETKRTIGSLVNLLQRLPNMIIRDDVAHEVYHSCSNWSLAFDSLKEPSKLSKLLESHIGNISFFGTAFLYAHNALRSSNGAFFDHSLLGLLYFEDDQKYGIYTPLFVPIGFALFLSTYRTYKIIFCRNNK